MKITSREKGLIILLIVVALIVFMIPGDENISLNGNQKISKTVINILIAKYRHIKPFKFEEKKKANNSTFVLKRNIFQYGSIAPNFNNQFQQQENKEEKERLEKEKQKLKDMEEPGKTLPQINFKILGTITVANGTKAIVVTKGPELFVFKEGETMFDKFILKSVDKTSVTIGYKGFEDVKTINLENKGGF